MHEHIAQDEFAYSKEIFNDRVVQVHKYNSTNWKEALCLVRYNSNQICNKYKTDGGIWNEVWGYS